MSTMLCDRCEHKLIEIDRDGERLTGCIECNCWRIECNCWRGDKSAFVVKLSVQNFAALRGLGQN